MNDRPKRTGDESEIEDMVQQSIHDYQPNRED